MSADQDRDPVVDQPASVARRSDLERLFLSSLPDIEKIVRWVGRRNRLSAMEQDDFAGEVKLALIEHEYAVLARFEGQSSLRTYLMTVIQRLFLDHRRKLWGKWRPSAEAQRRGPLALRLEALLYRDGLSVDEAVEALRSKFGGTESRDELADLARALPARTSRRSAGEEPLSTLAAGELATPDVQVEGALTARRAQDLVTEVMEALSGQDRLILRLRFEDDVSVAEVARLLKLDQKRLYRRIDGILETFRKVFHGRGLDWSEVRRMIERGQCHLRLLGAPRENETPRPSPSRAQV